MTFDITIGKIMRCKEDYDEMPKVYLINDIQVDEYCSDTVLPTVHMMPVLDYDLCEYTIWPRASFRSGGFASGFREFAEKTHNFLIEAYPNKRFPSHPFKIKPYLDKILNLDETRLDKYDDRLLWLKFWCKRSVDEYGDEAGIRFH